MLIFCRWWNLFLLLGLMCLAQKASSQSSTHLLTINYNGQPLSYVLADMEQRYQLRFAYSKEFLPMSEAVNVIATNQSLEKTLDALFTNLPVTYRIIGGQIVLRPAQHKVEDISQTRPPRTVEQQTPLYQDKRMQEILAEKRKMWREQMPGIQNRSLGNVSGTDSSSTQQENLHSFRFRSVIIEPDSITKKQEAITSAPRTITINDVAPPPAKKENRLAQISLLPYLGSNLLASNQLTNNVSFNVLWGTNGGVEGVEVGGIGNSIRNDVQGMQIAGMFNTVGDDVVGTQISGIANIVKDTLQGLQATGLFNIAGDADAVQAAGLFNITRNDFDGVQAAGLFNVSGGATNAVQAAGLFNVAGSPTKTQFAGLFNVAGDVEFAQISPILNAGKHVKGLQIGLINMADTISGMPIGLINVVRKGYNRIEFAGSDILYGNFSMKIGVKQFYNIFYLGARIDNRPDDNNVKDMSWGLGYGIGSAITLSPRLLLNLELVTMHVNEKDNWTEVTNNLNQFRLLLDGSIGKRTSLFAGPVGNLMISKLENPEGQVVGSGLPSYTLLDETTNGRNRKAWIGFLAGIRF